MYEFMLDQVFGISGLIKLSNTGFLVAVSARDVLKLRIWPVNRRSNLTPYRRPILALTQFW